MSDRAIQLGAYGATLGLAAFGAWCVWARTSSGARTRLEGSIGCDSPLGLLIALVGVLCGFGALLAGLAAAVSWRLRRDDGRPLGVTVSLGVLALSSLGAGVVALWLAAAVGQASFC